ncbi:hypothetical protein CIK05_01905 [Bdellovibrio sp. qaytius]|nr:hypothetical protein CIK05_01905 [Bdellovibrio sp. qaytius]
MKSFILDDKQLATRSTRSYSILALFLLPLSYIIRANDNLPTTPLWYIGLLIVIITFFLTSKYPRLPVKISVTLMITMALFTMLPGSEIAAIGSEHNVQMTYFGTYKFIIVCVALMAPFPHFIGYLLIALCLFIPPMQVLLFSPQIMKLSGQFEPWTTMGYALAGLLILHHRISTLKLHANLVESEAKEKNLRDFADVALALRDLTNTPLQSLDLLTELLRSDKISTQQASELLSKTTYRLRELMQVLSEQQKKLTKQQSLQSMDSMDIIRKTFSTFNDSHKEKN